MMKPSIRQKLERVEERLEELRRSLAAPDIIADIPKFRDLSVEYARLEPTAEAFADYRRLEQELSVAREMLSDTDSDMRALGAEEVAAVEGRLSARELELQQLLLPRD